MPYISLIIRDYVLTVCDNAKESCPVFFGKAMRLHHSFNDPAAVEGAEEKRLGEFRRLRVTVVPGELR
jgi:arsenate reductase (thioredoxin)